VTAKTRAEGVLLMLTMIWGSTFAAGKIILREMSPLQVTALRFALASVIIAILYRRSIFSLRLNQIVKGVVLGFFLFFGFILQTIGLTLTTASKSAFITSLMVVVVPFLQVIIERRLPRLGNVLGVLIVSVGLWFLTAPSGSTFNVGDALTLACAVLFGIYIVYLDSISHEMTTPQLTFIQVATNAVLASAGIALFDKIPARASTQVWIALAYLTVFATVLTTLGQTRFQKDTTPTRAVVIFTIEPVFAAVFASLLLGEEIGLLGATGGALILLGVLVSEISDSLPVLNKSLDFSDS
jgi:drug/metabolite transporter (DMT)-like permease